MTAAANKPLTNSYWVRPGRLLAGEYPLTGNEEESAVRLQDLLLCGVNTFIDLTDIGEMSPYEGHLPLRFAGKDIFYRRFPIRDHGIPASVEQMRIILDAVDAALAAGGGVYVHCRAGIGRTGTVIGCHLVRHGHDGEAAIDALNVLWRHCGRSAGWPAVPETDEQANFIRQYRDAGVSSTLSAPAVAQAHVQMQAQVPVQGSLLVYQGALLGLAIGDVLGTTRALASGVASADQLASLTNLAGLHWGGETAMTLALADSLLSCKQSKPLDQMQRYLAWQKQGKYTSHDAAETVPPLVVKALGLWQWKRNPVAGSHDPSVLDAHALARCTAMALFFARDPALAISECAESARTTIQSPPVLDACRVFAALLAALVEGVPLAALGEFKQGKAFAALRAVSLKPEILNLIDGGWRTAMTHPSGDDVVSVLSSALHALLTTQSFQAAVFKSMHNAARPATVAAVCGALAGACYGVQGLPIVWRETIPKVNELLLVAERLMTHAELAR